MRIFSMQIALFFFGSVISHACYLTSLPIAYAYGDVGLIYPLARGTAIIVASMVSHFYMREELSVCEGLGIIVAVVGIILLSYDAFLASKAKQLEDKNKTKISHIVYKELSTIDNSIELASRDFDESLEDYDFNEVDEKVLKNYNSSNNQSFSLSSFVDSTLEDKLKMSIIMAVGVGFSTASYSLLDSQGVSHIPPIIWSFWLNLSSSCILLPLLWRNNRNQMSEVFSLHPWSVLCLAPAAVGAYLIILYVFELPSTNVGLVVCLREVSVVIGAVLGVALLKESYSVLKFGSIALILTGIIMIKLSSS